MCLNIGVKDPPTLLMRLGIIMHACSCHHQCSILHVLSQVYTYIMHLSSFVTTFLTTYTKVAVFPENILLQNNSL